LFQNVQKEDVAKRLDLKEKDIIVFEEAIT
jgi:hypothetical protein